MSIPSGNGDITVGYFIASDNNPGTQVWKNATGAFVNNSDATYQSWLTGTAPVRLATVTNVADNGSGFCRLTVTQTLFGDLTSGQVLLIADLTGTPGANGVQTITLINPTTIDLGSVAFVASGQQADAGIFGPPVDTKAGINAQIDAYNSTINPPTYAAFTTAVTLTLTNPLATWNDITTANAGNIVKLPQANLFGSARIGQALRMQNKGLGPIQLRDSSNNVITSIPPAQYIVFTLIDNSTTHGLWEYLAPVISQAAAGGEGNLIIVKDNAFGNPTWTQVAVSGDATLAASGVLTLASTIAAGGPTGDASHVAQISYDAKGRLTAVTNVAIAIADSAITYGNESANRIFAGPSSGAAAAPTFRALVGADLPNPSATTLGGIESLAAVASKWINTISTSGVPNATQPSFSDLSGTISTGQQGGTAAGYLSGTYPNPNVIKVLGTTTNDNAAAGDVGEAPSSQSASTALVTGTGTALTSISLTAGDWDVWADIQFSSTNAGVTTVSLLAGSISSTSGAIDTTNVDRYDEVSGGNALLFTIANLPVVKAGPSRVSLASTTTYYVNAYAGFTGVAADVHAVGKIQARRRR